MPILSLRNAADTESHELHLSFPTEGGVETSGWSWLFRTIIFDMVGVDSGFQLVFDQSSKVGWFYTGKDISSSFFASCLGFLVVCRAFLISSFLCHRQDLWYGIYCMSWYLAVIWLYLNCIQSSLQLHRRISFWAEILPFSTTWQLSLHWHVWMTTAFQTGSRIMYTNAVG